MPTQQLQFQILCVSGNTQKLRHLARFDMSGLAIGWSSAGDEA